MTISSQDLLFWAGGECLERFGTIVRRTTSPRYLGEELKETFTRADALTVASYVDRDGYVRRVLANVLRPEYVAGLGYTLLLEKAATNQVWFNRQLDDATWVKTNMTAVRDQVGTDNVASLATRLTATAANGTCLQAITLASSGRYQSAYVKRITGTGVVEMTQDNGATWTPITVTSAWTRVTIPGQTLTNPTVGFRIVTSGDEIAVDLVQNEDGLLYATSPIPCGAAARSRAADRLEFPFYAHPQAMTIYADFIERAQPNWVAVGGKFGRIVQLGASADTNPRLILSKNSTTATYIAIHDTGTSVNSVVTPSPVPGDRMEMRLVLNADGSVQLGAAKNGGAESLGTASAANALVAAWSTPTLVSLGCIGALGQGDIALRSLKIARGVHSMDEMRAAS